MSEITPAFVLLLRVPGSLAKVGVTRRAPPDEEHYPATLQALAGKSVALDLQTHLEVVLKNWCAQPSDIPWEEGFMIWAGQRDNKFETPGWWQAAQCKKLRGDPTLQVRLQRGGMQTDAKSSHTGEARWCNVDQYLDETVSSTCAVVGFFVGYSVTLPKRHIRALPISPAAGGVVRGLE